MAISPQGVIWSTSCLVIGKCFRGWRIKWRYFQLDQIQQVCGKNNARGLIRFVTIYSISYAHCDELFQCGGPVEVCDLSELFLVYFSFFSPVVNYCLSGHLRAVFDTFFNFVHLTCCHVHHFNCLQQILSTKAYTFACFDKVCLKLLELPISFPANYSSIGGLV